MERLKDLILLSDAYKLDRKCNNKVSLDFSVINSNLPVALARKDVFGMRQDELVNIKRSIGKAIKEKFGEKIKGIEIFDVVNEPSHQAFKIRFIAYEYFVVVFNYELDIIGFSIELNEGRYVSLLNRHDCYSDISFDKYLEIVQENLELRIPDKYLKAHGWLQF